MNQEQLTAALRALVNTKIDFVIGGSLALITTGAIPARPMDDLDIMLKNDYARKDMLKAFTHIEDTDGRRARYAEASDSDYPYRIDIGGVRACLFVNENAFSSTIQYDILGTTVRVVPPHSVMHYKAEYIANYLRMYSENARNNKHYRKHAGDLAQFLNYDLR